MAGLGLAMVTACVSAADAPPSASDEVLSVSALMTDDHEVYIDRPADEVWAEIKRLYVEGDRYVSYGHQVVPLENDPKAFLGGYRAEPAPGQDGRAGVFRFSDIDDEKRFLAMSIDADGIENITVSHWVLPAGDGARYSVIINAFFPVEGTTDALPSQDKVRQKMTALLDDHHEGLSGIMDTVKAEIEALPK